jgi:hypothetical protein
VRYRAVLDATAIAAYAAGSEHVGEVLGEFADEKAQFGLPVACLIEARTAVTDREAQLLDLLVDLPLAVPLGLEFGPWRQVAAATQLLGGLGRPEAYGEGIETIPV